jgi:hypothetical protein
LGSGAKRQKITVEECKLIVRRAMGYDALGKIVSGYEVNFADKTKAYKKELAKAIFIASLHNGDEFMSGGTF